MKLKDLKKKFPWYCYFHLRKKSSSKSQVDLKTRFLFLSSVFEAMSVVHNGNKK